LPLWAEPKAHADGPTSKSAAETAVKALYNTLSHEQKKIMCFDWDHKDPAAACCAAMSPTTGRSPNRESEATSIRSTSKHSSTTSSKELSTRSGTPGFSRSSRTTMAGASGG